MIRRALVSSASSFQHHGSKPCVGLEGLGQKSAITSRRCSSGGGVASASVPSYSWTNRTKVWSKPLRTTMTTTPKSPCSALIPNKTHRAYSASAPVWLPAFHSTIPTLDAAGYSMAALKSLRTASGAPIVECKKALEAAAKEIGNGGGEQDAELLQAALDWLRQHGAAKASSKVADRATTEGLVSFISTYNGQSAALVKVASETDFAGRSETFVKLVETVAHAVLSTTPSSSTTTTSTLSKEDIAQIKSADAGKTVQELMDEAILSIRENISVSTVVQLHAAAGGEDSHNNNGSMWVGYVHNRVHSESIAGTAAAAVLIAPVEGGGDKNINSINDLEAIGKKLAMHVVAAQPQYLRPEDVPDHVVAKEKDILQQQMSSSGKPPEIVEKIVHGKLLKFFEEICLLEQGHMVEEKNPKVKTYLAERGITLKQYELIMI